jgi:hypothetical protein
VIEALQAYLQPPSAEDEIIQLKQRLQQVEVMMQAMQRHFPI